ncbi:hypothetical protein H0H92_008024 [Tricholoma furcatifolium]|nr:hypothetical protein H0H92_008024 [Tricholoma furcatifolium]
MIAHLRPRMIAFLFTIAFSLQALGSVNALKHLNLPHPADPYLDPKDDPYNPLSLENQKDGT